MFVERTEIDSPVREAGFQERFGGSYPHDDTNLRLGKVKSSNICPKFATKGYIAV